MHEKGVQVFLSFFKYWLQIKLLYYIDIYDCYYNRYHTDIYNQIYIIKIYIKLYEVHAQINNFHRPNNFYKQRIFLLHSHFTIKNDL